MKLCLWIGIQNKNRPWAPERLGPRCPGAQVPRGVVLIMSPKYKTVKRNDDVATAKRIFVVGALFACSFGILASRAVYFHLRENHDLEGVALRQYRTAVNQSTRRGKVLDTAGRDLAIDVTVESIYANPREVTDPVEMTQTLSKLVGVDRSPLLERLASNRKFVWVKRRVDDRQTKAVMGLNLRGIYSMREGSRSYPGGELAATILGAVGFEGRPLGGVELVYNDILSAKGGVSDVKRDARGYLYLSPTTEESEEPKLTDVELTIDKTIEFIAERELQKAVVRTHAKGGSVVVADVNSGALLAVANFPTFDPNDYGRYNLSNWRNRAISDAYEPGSTFKTVIIAAALDRQVVSQEDILDCEMGSIRIGDKVVRDAHPYGRLSVADIIKVSSNIGAYKVESRLGPRSAYDAIRAFGFGSPTGIDLPGESAGLLTPFERWSPIQFATIAFGQGIAATPLQMTMAFAAIANGGVLYRPYILKRVVGDGADIISEDRRMVVGRPISEATAKIMSGLLKRVTEKGGTGRLAASLEYPVAGKTGTAQKADPRTGGYAAGKYYSSFVGFAPADNPRISVYVGIDEPSGGMYYGGQVAAPVFREVVEATLHYLKVPGQVVVAAGEPQGAHLPSQTTAELAVVLSANQEPRQLIMTDESQWQLPDLTGLTMRDVLKAAEGAEIEWRFKGSGIAVRQDPQPGSTLPRGGVCEVEFRPLM